MFYSGVFSWHFVSTDLKMVTCNLIMSLSFGKEDLLIFISTNLYFKESIKWKCPLAGEVIKGNWRGLHFLRMK